MPKGKKEIEKILSGHAEKEMIEYAEKHPEDIGLLFESLKELQKQKKSGTEESQWSKDFLEGYSACLNDLKIIKKGNWANS